MNNATLLHILIAVHTLVALVSMASLIYLPYAAVKGHSPARDRFLLFALLWPLANLILIAANGMVCPMQSWAQDLSGEHTRWVRDIYFVPERWLGTVPWTYPAGYLLGVALVFGRLWWPATKRASKSAPPRHQASP